VVSNRAAARARPVVHQYNQAIKRIGRDLAGCHSGIDESRPSNALCKHLQTQVRTRERASKGRSSNNRPFVPGRSATSPTKVPEHRRTPALPLTSTHQIAAKGSSWKPKL
jgi:hypothetical protein